MFVTFLLFLLLPSTSESIDVLALRGLTVEQLQEIVPVKQPQNPNWEAGESIDVHDWRGWKKVTFSFNGKGRLSSITFSLERPLSPERAEALAISKMGLSLPGAKRVVAPVLISYRNLRGPVRTVNFSNETELGNLKRIEMISVFYAIGWSE